MTFPFPIVTPNVSSAEVAYISGASDVVNRTVYTFSAQNIGTESADRFVIVAANGTRNATGGTISGITLGGSAMTLLAGSLDSSNFNYSAIYGLAYPTGTTANIVVTYGQAQNSSGIQVYAATGLSSTTPTSTATSTAVPGALSITCPSGGFVVATSAIRATATFTWASATEVMDEQIDTGTNNFAQTGAIATSAGALSITATPSSGTSRIVSLAVAMK